MARKPMVTRTLTTTKVTALCLDIQSGEPCNREIILPRTYKSEKIALKKAKELAETDALKVVDIVNTEVINTLYGMSEEKFIENAEVLPNREAK